MIHALRRPVAVAAIAFGIAATARAQPACFGDLTGDGNVDITDLAIVLSDFGCAPPDTCVGDVDGDRVGVILVPYELDIRPEDVSCFFKFLHQLCDLKLVEATAVVTGTANIGRTFSNPPPPRTYSAHPDHLEHDTSGTGHLLHDLPPYELRILGEVFLPNSERAEVYDRIQSGEWVNP